MVGWRWTNPLDAFPPLLSFGARRRVGGGCRKGGGSRDPSTPVRAEADSRQVGK